MGAGRRERAPTERKINIKFVSGHNVKNGKLHSFVINFILFGVELVPFYFRPSLKYIVPECQVDFECVDPFALEPARLRGRKRATE